jgi:uncharacterized protein YbcI
VRSLIRQGKGQAVCAATGLPARQRRAGRPRLSAFAQPGCDVSAQSRLHGGELAAAISNVVVRELASTTGRGPTKAKTTLGENAVFVVLQDTLTRGELNLVEAGESGAVLGLRRLWQSVMRDSCSRAIEGLTGRKVVGFMSDNHIDPDIAVEVFILEPILEDPAVDVALAAVNADRG